MLCYVSFVETWIHGGCSKIKSLLSRLAIDVKCSKGTDCHEMIEDQKEILYDEYVRTVTDF